MQRAVVRKTQRLGNDWLDRRQTGKVADVPPLMIVKPRQRRDGLKFSKVDRRRHSDAEDLDTISVCFRGFGHSGRAAGR